MYQTSGDVLGTISIKGLERAAHFYVHFVEGAACATLAELAPQEELTGIEMRLRSGESVTPGVCVAQTAPSPGARRFSSVQATGR